MVISTKQKARTTYSKTQLKHNTDFPLHSLYGFKTLIIQIGLNVICMSRRNENSSFSKELRTADSLLLLQRQVSTTHLKVKTCGPEPFSDHFTHFGGGKPEIPIFVLKKEVILIQNGCYMMCKTSNSVVCSIKYTTREKATHMITI